jgi:hypothetical protein
MNVFICVCISMFYSQCIKCSIGLDTSFAWNTLRGLNLIKLIINKKDKKKLVYKLELSAMKKGLFFRMTILS